MTVTTFANGTISQRVAMIEAALEKVLDRQGMEIALGIEPGSGMDVMVVDGIYSDFAVRGRVAKAVEIPWRLAPSM